MTRRLAWALAVVALVAGGCSEGKKVGSGIDVEQVSEEGRRLGEIELPEKEEAGGFVGEQEERAQEQAQQGNPAGENAPGQESAQAASVSFAITSSGFDPYVIRVYVDGVISVTNRDSVPRTVTADRGEFDSGQLAPGASWTYKPPREGKFNFHDETRPFVVGTMEVLPR